MVKKKRQSRIGRGKKKPEKNKKKRKYVRNKFEITYFDPLRDSEETTWRFKNYKDAVAHRKELAYFWGDKPSKIPIDKMNPHKLKIKQIKIPKLKQGQKKKIVKAHNQKDMKYWFKESWGDELKIVKFVKGKFSHKDEFNNDKPVYTYHVIAEKKKKRK